MHDPLTFEARLSDAFDRLLIGTPAAADVGAVAAQAMATSRRRSAFSPSLFFSRSRWSTVVIVSVLLVALAASVAFLVGRLVERPIVPHVYRNTLVGGPSLAVPRGQPAVVRLRDGRVLIVGGNVGLTTTAEVLDLSTGTSTPTGPLVDADALVISSVAMLPDGRVLLVGDARPASAPFYAVAQVFDASTLAFKAVGPEVIPRAGANLIGLADGRVLMTGGVDPIDINTTIGSAELFDSVTETFAGAGTMLDSRQFHSTTLLSDGRVLLVGGEHSEGGGGSPLASAELYDPISGTFSAAGLMLAGGRVIVVSLHDGRAVVLAGSDVDGPATAGIWTGGSFIGAPAPPEAPGQGILLDDGRLLLTGAWAAGTWVGTYDVATGATTMDNVTGGWVPTLVKLDDGRVLLVGGLEDGDIHNPDLGGQLAPPVSIVQVFE